MKKIIAVLAIIMTVTFFVGCQADTTTTTTAPIVTVDTDNFIDIATVAQLQAIELNKSYRLTADLDLSGIEWVPLGTYDEPYLGIFDGNNHVISNMQITNRNGLFNGLFAHVAGTVKDLEIKDFTIDYTAPYLTYAGGLSGYLSGDLDNVRVSGSIHVNNTKSNTFVGLMSGLVTAKITQTMTADQFVANTVTNVYATGSIDVNTKNFLFVGGLFGKIYNTELTGAVVDADIVAVSQNYRVYAGGLTGHHYGGILVGFDDYVDSTDIPVENNFASGSITVTSQGTHASIGGLIGYSQYSILNDNIAFVDIDYTGKNIYASPFIGEAWNTVVNGAIASSAISVDINDSEGVAKISSLCGIKNPETDLSNHYYLVDTDQTLDSAVGTLASTANLADPAWYTGKLDWDETGITLVDIAAYHQD
ncbi:MAG: hypothetical protein JXB20_03175 [Bacilli bacterium]|nr:hypothetical protein [Bacilli bacterium]MBN2696975.1 hypothetical protein [Bacilli bacterium]